MVVTDKILYLFVGPAPYEKDSRLKALRRHLLDPHFEQFNLDVLYAEEINLKILQEKLLFEPVHSARRLLIMKDADALKDDIRTFLLEYVKVGRGKTIVALDFEVLDVKNNFFKLIAPFAQIEKFAAALEPDTFALSRQIEMGKADLALRVLNRLLDNGERPERILGGLRYACEREVYSVQESKKRLKLLLQCDLDIKRGKLKPEFALERLIVCLCGFRKL